MEELMIQYNALVEEEDGLFHQMDVCNECLELLFDYVSEKGEMLHLPTMETIVTSIHTMYADYGMELLHLRLEKAVLNSKLRGRPSGLIIS